LALLATAALVTFALAGGYAVRTGLSALERTHAERVSETAEVMLARLGSIVDTRMDQVGWAVQIGAIRDALAKANAVPADAPLDSGLAAPDSDNSRALEAVYVDVARRVFGRTDYNALWITDVHGRVVAATVAGLQGARFDSAPWWQAAQSNARQVLGLVPARGGVSPGLAVAVRLDDPKGGMIGVAHATLSAAWMIREAAGATQLRTPSDILLTTAEGDLIFSRRPFRFLENVADRPFFAEALGEKGFVTLPDATPPRLVAYAGNPNAPAIGTLGWRVFISANRDAVLRDSLALQRELLAILAAAALLTGGLTWLLAHSLLRPLTRLRDAARAMAAGDLTTRVSVNGRDELADLAKAFNVMADRVQEHTKELRNDAMTDVLTKLLNRRGFLATGQTLWDQCRRYGHALTAVALDIDHFKAVNDTYGHDVGDIVLKRTADVFARGVRTSDIAGRLGGEEFCGILPETPRDSALILAERLRVAVETAPCETPAGPVPVTISIGVASMTASDSSLEALLKRADEALYAAKNNGRNRVVVAS